MTLRTYLVYNTIVRLCFLPNLSCLQNNSPENNVEQFPPNLSCLQNNPPENNVEDLAGTCSTLFSGGLFWDQFLLDLRSLFGAPFRYKSMYYYFYHGSDLHEIMWNQFPPSLSCLQNNPPENNVEDLAGTHSTLFSGELFWDRFLLDLRSRVPAKSELPPKQSAGE